MDQSACEDGLQCIQGDRDNEALEPPRWQLSISIARKHTCELSLCEGGDSTHFYTPNIYYLMEVASHHCGMESGCSSPAARTSQQCPLPPQVVQRRWAEELTEGWPHGPRAGKIEGPASPWLDDNVYHAARCPATKHKTNLHSMSSSPRP